MLIVAVLCLCAAIVIAGLGIWLLSRPRSQDAFREAVRGVAPTQLAAAVMLAAGGAVALSAPPEMSLVVVIVCVIGAVGTVAAARTGAYSLSSNRVDTAAGTYGGAGWVISPDGALLARTTPAEPFCTVDLDLQAPAAAQASYPRYVFSPSRSATSTPATAP